MDPASQPAAVQPDAPESADGQGAEGLGLYDLSSAPEELRPLLEQELKKVDANVTRRFQEHSEFRKQWEPLSGIEGLADVPPEELSELIQFRQIASDPEQLENWWNTVGEEMGFFDNDDDPDPSGDQPAGLEQFTERILAQLEERLKPIEERFSQNDRENAVAAAGKEIDRKLGELEQSHGDGFDRVAVLQLSQAYDTEDALDRGYGDWLRISGQAQSELVENKLTQPGGAINGGQADSQPETISSFKEAKAAALSRLAGAR